MKLIILIKGGKVNDLKLFFNNLTDKGGDQQSGQQECLANLANQKQDQKIVAFGPSLAGKTVVRGDFGLGPIWTSLTEIGKMSERSQHPVKPIETCKLS